VARPVPYLAYGSGAYLGRLTELLLKQAGAVIHLDRVYETDMAEGLKVMALEGHGVAFLPHSAVRRELEAGRLVSAPRRRTCPACRCRWNCAPTASVRPKPSARTMRRRPCGSFCSIRVCPDMQERHDPPPALALALALVRSTAGDYSSRRPRHESC
jgi:hypothetical protein